MDVEWKRVDRGDRSAWVSNVDSIAMAVDPEDSCRFTQGADVMPRSALFHRFKKQPNGRYEMSPIEADGDLYYLLDDSKKKCCADMVAKDFDPKFIYECFLSKHMSPFFLAAPALVIIPGERHKDGTWNPITDEDMALLNASTNAVFKRIGKEPDCGGSLEVLLKRKIDILGKLTKQSFATKRWLVLSNAGGANPCAAYVDLKFFDEQRIIVDQTLYWHIAESENEAKYLTGILNSEALASAIKDFQPQGEFGRRHIHTLPYKVTPQYDNNNILHKSVVVAVSRLMTECQRLYAEPEFSHLVHPDGGRLNSRRRIVQGEIRKLKSYKAYESACAAVFAAGVVYREKKQFADAQKLGLGSTMIASAAHSSSYELPKTEYLEAASKKKAYDARPNE